MKHWVSCQWRHFIWTLVMWFFSLGFFIFLTYLVGLPGVNDDSAGVRTMFIISYIVPVVLFIIMTLSRRLNYNDCAIFWFIAIVPLALWIGVIKCYISYLRHGYFDPPIDVVDDYPGANANF